MQADETMSVHRLITSHNAEEPIFSSPEPLGV